jgi:hypothetical protein
MRKVELSRTEFVAWLGEQSKNRAFFAPLSHSSGHSELSLVWPDEDLSSAPIISVDSADVRDFLAFATTYVGTYAPFTAFFRVVAREMIGMLPTDRPQWIEGCLEALIGVMICDAAVQVRDNASSKVSDISLQACLATPSAAVVRTALLGYDSEFADVVLQRWFTVREELPNGAIRIRPEQLILFWTTILSAFSGSSPTGASPDHRALSDFISSVYSGGGVAHDHALGQIAVMVPGVHNLAQALRGNREDRVRVLEQFAASLGPARSPIVNGMILGYLAAQVADGSLNYIQLASRFADKFPLSVLWFGLFSGLNRNNDILTAGECLGRRIERRVKAASGLGPISADFSYEEFTLLLQEGRLGRVRTDSQTILEIELIPGVTGRFRRQPNTRVNENALRGASAWEEVRKVAAQLQHILRSAEVDQTPQKPQLFDDRNRSPDPPKSRNSLKRKYK